ncbi:MAG: ABC transporter permease [Flavobacteriales bacterium]
MQLVFTALKFMRFDKPKSIGALFGVVISIFLIGQQTGIFTFLTNAMSYLVRTNKQYVWVTDDKTTNANALSPIDMRIGYELESVPGVKKVYPLVLTSGAARFPNGTSSGLTIVGLSLPSFSGLNKDFLYEGSTADLVPEGAVTTDVFDAKALGDSRKGDYFEINGKQVYIAAQTRGARSFGGVYSYTTIERARYLGNVSADKASAFLVEYEPGTDSTQLVQVINQHIPGVKAWLGADFAQSTVLTVLKSSGIAISFGTLIVFALISGFIIIGLTLYSATIDRIRDYGTLKAIGATNGYIRRLILMQALIYAILGFIIGYALIEGFRTGIAKAGTLFTFAPETRIAFFIITAAIALGGTLFAIRRIVKLEPASVFRG